MRVSPVNASGAEGCFLAVAVRCCGAVWARVAWKSGRERAAGSFR